MQSVFYQLPQQKAGKNRVCPLKGSVNVYCGHSAKIGYFECARLSSMVLCSDAVSAGENQDTVEDVFVCVGLLLVMLLQTFMVSGLSQQFA